MNRAIVAALVVGVSALTQPARANADVVLDWNGIMLSSLTGQNVFAQARIAATTQLAVFEAVNAVTRDYRPYLGTIVAPHGASADAAAIAAAHHVLRSYLPASAATLDTARAASLQNVPDGAAKESGIALGEAAAAAMIALRINDGSTPPAFHLPSSLEPGEWQLTPSCPPSGGVFLHWGDVKPFGIRNARHFLSKPPPRLQSRLYARDYNEVNEVGALDSSQRPQNRTDVARFYAAVLAVATWNPAVSQVAATRNWSLTRNARAFALLNMAIMDGLIAVMDTKYQYNYWRPETAIPRGEEDGNPQTEANPLFTPFIVTPCFPSYPSAHATASYAARVVAERLFGSDDHSIALSSAAVPDVTLHYGSFEEITDDIDDARVYGGIHFRFDQRAGADQGRRVGNFIVAHHLQRVWRHR
jgi:hypothetical protein